MSAMTRLIQTVGDAVFPPACDACQATISSAEAPWCPSCARELLQAVAGGYCARCGACSGPYQVDTDGCAECRDVGRRLDGFARVGTYHSIVGQMLKRFKFGHQHRLDASLGTLLADAISSRSWYGEIDALVPVPTDFRSRLRYRCHPAGAIARVVGRRLGLDVLPVVLVRGKRRRQTQLSHTDRPANVRGIFHVRSQARLAGAKLCVIDDVSTTGATLREMARVLRAAGAAAVYGATVARTEHDRTDREWA